MNDLVLGFILAKLFGKGGAATPPAVQFQSPQAPSSPAPSSAAPQPAAKPVALPPSPAFPNSVEVPPQAAAPQQAPPAGFKRAIEVWIVRPDLQQQAAQVVGAAPQLGPITVQMAKSNFPTGWQAAKTATPAEAAMAKKLLAEWKDGMVVFLFPSGGPETLSTIRAFKMTKHPAAAATVPAAAPAAAPAAPTVPASVPAAPAAPAAPVAPVTVPPAAAAPAPTGPVTTLPEMVIPASAPAAPSRMVTTVRRGEGLAQVAKRLGKPATGASAAELRNANIPTGPDASWSAAKDGNLKRAGRAGGLQPGDHLFVPASWGPIDAARL